MPNGVWLDEPDAMHKSKPVPLKAALALASLLMALVCSGHLVLQWWLFGTLVETEGALGLLFWKNLLELAASASVLALLLSRKPSRLQRSFLMGALSVVMVGKIVDLGGLGRHVARGAQVETSVLLGYLLAVLYIAVAAMYLPTLVRELRSGIPKLP
jgi:hypothetical protein